jgi:ribose transport system ATP-binding protein
LTLEGISKTYGAATVLDDVSVTVRPGSIHALVGHNGAGKSTLMKIALGGVVPSSGRVLVRGTDVTGAHPAVVRGAGLGMVLQELSLAPTMNGLENIFLGADKISRIGTVARRAERTEIYDLLARLGIATRLLRVPVYKMTVGQQHLIEIAKAIRLTRSVLILDEPTAPLDEHEKALLFDVVHRTAELGTGIIFISHNLSEVFDLCDEITVLREGKVTLNSPIADVSMPAVIDAMIGHELEQVSRAPSEEEPARAPLLEARNVSVGRKLAGLSFSVMPGEIVGVAGLGGSGRSTLLRSLFGDARRTGGSFRLAGRGYDPSSPADAIHRGVFLIPEDRHRYGLLLDASIENNIALPILSKLHSRVVYQPRRARETAQGMVRSLDIKTRSVRQKARELSGGNQQKVVLAKALGTGARFFLLDEPTFGVDISVAAELLQLIREQAGLGKGILWVSSDLKELVAAADRILILANSTIAGQVLRGEPAFTEGGLIKLIHQSERTAPSSGEEGSLP